MLLQCNASCSLYFVCGEMAGVPSKSKDLALILCITKGMGTCGTSQVTGHSEIQWEPMAQQEDPRLLCAWTSDTKAQGLFGSGSLLGSTQLDLELVMCDCAMIKVKGNQTSEALLWETCG